MPRGKRPDIVLGRIARLAGEKRKLQEQTAKIEAELVEECRKARAMTPAKTLEEIAQASGYSRAWIHRVTGNMREAADADGIS